MKRHLPNYGGQAVIEGVMMRGQVACAIAVRAPDQSIRVEHQQLGRLYRTRWAQIPFLRGLLLLWDALVLGLRALAFSATVQAGEEENLEGAPLLITMVVAMLVGVSLFFLLPASSAHVLGDLLSLSPWLSNVIEGLIRLGLLIAYIWAIGFMPDVRRVYGYHGAEHMTINAFEAGARLDVDSVQRFPREHPRCGTAFLLTVVVTSVIVFTLLGPLDFIPRLASRLVLIPFLAGISYEYIRLTAKVADKRWARPVVSPNLAIQRLTTRPPDRDMLEVAIAAFEAMKAAEQKDEAAPPAAQLVA